MQPTIRQTDAANLVHTPARRAPKLAAGALVSLVALTLLGGCNTDISDADIEKDAVTLRDVQDAVEKPGRNELVVDARTRAEWELRRIPSAVNLSTAQVSGVQGQLDPRLERFSRMIVYGDNPGSAPARALTKKLIITGYRDVRFFPGGLMEWQRAGLPTRSTSPSDGPGPLNR
jgi:3-mercaptopyruvate sulfurtransferase SseA